MVHNGYHPFKIVLLGYAWMVHSGYHPLKHRPLRIVLGWCTVDIILLSIAFRIMLWMVHSGYHPLKHRPLRIVLGWCTVDIILLNMSS